MSLKIIRADITTLSVDAIVNAANSSLLGGGGVDGAIHRAAGPRLLEACRKLNGCRTGEAKATPGFDLPAKYVIHTVGPIWGQNGKQDEPLLRACYVNSLKLAESLECESVAFPLISAGAYGCPKDIALRVAVEEISSFVLSHDTTVYLTVFDPASFKISAKWFADLESFVDDNYVESHLAQFERSSNMTWGSMPRQASTPSAEGMPPADGMAQPYLTPQPNYAAQPVKSAEKKKKSLFPGRSKKAVKREEAVFDEDMAAGSFQTAKIPTEAIREASKKESLQDLLEHLDEPFSVRLLNLIDSKGMTDAECYKKANIDRKLFSKIRNDRNYRPSKLTALAFCIALELDLEETRSFLGSAGYALSRANKSDVIVEFFISHRRYNIFEINEALFAYDQPLLGS